MKLKVLCVVLSLAVYSSAASTAAPSTVAPSTVAPSTAAPSTAAPSTAAPSTAAPSTAAPSTAAPSTAAPSTAAPLTAAPSTVAPSTAAPSTAAPSTAAPSTAAPSTAAPSTAAPSTVAPSTAAPSTAAPSTAAPSTAAPSTAAPSTASPSTAAPSRPSTAAPSTAAPSTAAPSTAAPSTAAPSTAVAPSVSISALKTAVTVPSNFNYSCASDGEISIQKNALGSAVLKIVNPPNCMLNDTTSNYVISGCKKNKGIIILLEATQNHRIVGGRSFKEFQLLCKDGPYTVNVTAAVSVPAPTSYTTLPAVTPPRGTSTITMEIYENVKSVLTGNAKLGQALTLKITESGSDTIAPVQCYASHSNLTYMFWSNSSCAVDETLVGNEWKNDTGKSVSIAFYAFHFEGSNDIDIMCTVQVCPPNYEKFCSLTCPATPISGKRRKRRETAIDKTVEVVNVRTKLHVFDTNLSASHSNGLHASMILLLMSAAISKMGQ